jgi:hypothetical protein
VSRSSVRLISDENSERRDAGLEVRSSHTVGALDSRPLPVVMANADVFNVRFQGRLQPNMNKPVWSSKVQIMTVYVAEIKGRGIAAFHADNGAEAERLVRDRVFRDDLMVLASNGLPLWDGVAGIQVRQALPWEEAKWRASRAGAIRQCNIEREDDSWIAFLVVLTDPDR